MFDEMDKTNIYKNEDDQKVVKTNNENANIILVSPTNANKKDSSAPLENDRIILTIEEKLDDHDIIVLDGIKFKGIEEIKKDPILQQMESLSDGPIIDGIEM